jgi:hypothetical protein
VVDVFEFLSELNDKLLRVVASENAQRNSDGNVLAHDGGQALHEAVAFIIRPIERRSAGHEIGKVKRDLQALAPEDLAAIPFLHTPTSRCSQRARGRNDVRFSMRVGLVKRCVTGF